jgi:hypothetical protein
VGRPLAQGQHRASGDGRSLSGPLGLYGKPALAEFGWPAPRYRSSRSRRCPTALRPPQLAALSFAKFARHHSALRSIALRQR